MSANLIIKRRLVELQPAPDFDSIVGLVAEVFPGLPCSVERVAEGVSTWVYRIRRDGEVLYLRVLPAEEGSFAPEVLVHQALRDRNVRVPDVIYFEARNRNLGCSVMIVAEIPGYALGHSADPLEMRKALIEAGKDLAIINSIGVNGFGWMLRRGPENGRLQAEYSTYREFIHQHVDEYITLLVDNQVLSSRESIGVGEILARFDHFFEVDSAVLAHGDWDATHSYQRQGAYSGIIDFGEIRGANLLYDLGHFSIENSAMLPYVLEGYREVAQLPPITSSASISPACLSPSGDSESGSPGDRRAGSATRIFLQLGGICGPSCDKIS